MWEVFNQYFSLRPPVLALQDAHDMDGRPLVLVSKAPEALWFQVSVAAQGAQIPLTCPLVICSPCHRICD